MAEAGGFGAELPARAMILVTGGSGFLGGAVIRELRHRGASPSEPKVRALVRPSSDRAVVAELGVDVAEGDLTRPETLPFALSGVQVVYHCAGTLGQAGVADEAYYRLHVGGTENLLRAARRAGVGRFVHVSSPGVLGPIRDTPAHEDSPYRPTNAYERSKAASERRALALAAALAIPLVVVRPEFVYGPHDMHVLRLFQAIASRRFFYIGNGGALCHPTFVEDAARGIVDAGERGRDGAVYHFAGPAPIPIRKLVETIAEALGVAPPRLCVPEKVVRAGTRLVEAAAQRFGRSPPITMSAVDFFTFDRQFSWQKARVELGWEPQVDLHRGAERAVEWYRKHGLLP